MAVNDYSSQVNSRLTFAEMMFMRKAAGYIWSDFKRNEILQELEVKHIMVRINQKVDCTK